MMVIRQIITAIASGGIRSHSSSYMGLELFRFWRNFRRKPQERRSGCKGGG